MKKRLLLFLLAAVLLAVSVPVFADDAPIWSNFNGDPVMNGPKYFVSIPIKADTQPVLVTRIRTYHWNSGNGAQPGTISLYEGDECLGTWQAVGRSAYGVMNVYWEVLTDVLLMPGHSYRVKVSDSASWSYNEGSKNCGMYEIYGEWPAPEGYVPSAQTNLADPVFTAPATEPVVTLVNTAADVPLRTGVTTYPFGRWEQDGSTANGPEPIQWQLLTVRNGGQLLISDQVIDVMSYPEMMGGETWETSTLRTWLNGTFYNSAFTQAEKNQILTVTNENPDNTRFGTKGGNKTQDRVFLLSIPEAEQYFKTDAARSAAASAYARAKAVSQDYISMWYLRSPGVVQNGHALVGADGAMNYGGPLCESGCDSVIFGVRPAIWLALPTGFRVTYNGGNCLAKVPTDGNLYQPGDKVSVLFDPVEYISGLIFYGWDGDGDGVADFGYYYNEFVMPNHDVELQAICYVPVYDNQEPDPQPNRDPVNTLFPPNNLNVGTIIIDGGEG